MNKMQQDLICLIAIYALALIAAFVCARQNKQQ